jgi:hypothetical protein
MATKKKLKPIFGQIFDASKSIPPKWADLLLFHDEVFQWALGAFDSKTRKYISRWSTPVLYWAISPPRSLLRLKSRSSVLRS